MTQASLLTHVTQTIIDRFHPKRIMVFGSHARGETGPDSDLDLFIEMETPRRPPDRAIDVSEAFGLRAWPMDIVVYTPEEFCSGKVRFRQFVLIRWHARNSPGIETTISMVGR